MTAGAQSAGLKLLQRPAQVEAALWRRLHFENDARCRERLFELYTPLARAIARREQRRRPSYGLDSGDFLQFAYGALLEAIDRFEPLRGVPFEVFARRRIRGAIADGGAASSEAGAQYRYRSRAERLASLRTKDKGSTDYITTLAHLAASLAIGLIAEESAALEQVRDDGLDAYESLSWRELRLAVIREIDRLPEKERFVMGQHYLSGVAFNTIAQLLGVSKGRVSQLHSSAIGRVRERLRDSE